MSTFQDVARLVSGIATVSQEQNTAIRQVSDSISRLDDTTQRNTALVEEAAAGAESLEEQAQELSRAVAMFNLRDDSKRRLP